MTRNELTKLWAKVTGKFNALIDGAPEALDTLKEIADKLGDDDDALAGLLTQVGSKQDALVSGTNIKSINGQSVLGSGDIVIPSGEKGDKGDKGDTGATGATGATGPQGPKGDKGDKGDQGNSGYTGAAGELEVVNNLTDGGAARALSAEMGIVIRDVIEQIFNALGEYSFPNGKPTIDWAGGSIAINLNLSDFSSSNMAQTIQRGEAYTTTLTATDLGNLYVPYVVITMGDEDITATAYDTTTGVVSIAEVTGALVITAAQYTYVQDNLSFMLDCTKRGGQAGHWIDLVGGKDFVLTDVTEADSGLVFNGNTSKGVASGGLDVAYDTSTIEVIATIENFPTATTPRIAFLGNSLDGCVAAGCRYPSQKAGGIMTCATSGTNISHPQDRYNVGFYFSNTNVAIANTKDNVVIDGVLQTSPRDQGAISVNDYMLGLSSVLAVGYQNVSGTDYFLKGKIMCIRVYNTKLTSAQMIANYEIDKKRFNLT